MSAWPEKRGEIKKMMEMAAKDIERLGGTVEMVDVGKQKVSICLECGVSPLLFALFWLKAEQVSHIAVFCYYTSPEPSLK